MNAQTSIIPFSFSETDQIRSFIYEDTPWFIASDVCKVLGLKNTSITIKSVDEDSRSKFNLGRQGNTWCVNEDGLYTIVLRCDDALKEGTIAYRFRRWVTKEVLPAIRKHGTYVNKEVEQQLEYKKPWYVEQLLALAQRYTVSEAALKQVISITERAWKQGYAVAMAKVEKEQAEQGNNNKNSDNSSVAVPFSTVLNMLTTASYITDRFQYYVETSQMINDVMRRLEIVLNDTRGLAAMADMSMPMIKGCLKGLDYTEEQKKEVDRVLSPYGQRLADKAA